MRLYPSSCGAIRSLLRTSKKSCVVKKHGNGGRPATWNEFLYYPYGDYFYIKYLAQIKNQ